MAKHGQVLRPIERELWSEDVDTRNLFAFNHRAKLSVGFEQYRQRFPSASAGVQIAGTGLGGGTYVPPTAPHNPGNLGTT